MELETFAMKALLYMTLAFMFILVFLVIMVIVMYIFDVTQTKHTIRRNYPVVGRFRYIFEYMGGSSGNTFAMDREELPFNRAQRSWVYRQRRMKRNIAFGSTRDITNDGGIYF